MLYRVTLVLTKDHPHNHGEVTGGRRLLVSIVLNLIITLVEIAGGLMSGSLALLTDAMHNLNDTASLCVSYVAQRLRCKAPDAERSYGYRVGLHPIENDHPITYRYVRL
jgi:cobalt-zinc-cadmium efflux system protein